MSALTSRCWEREELFSSRPEKILCALGLFFGRWIERADHPEHTMQWNVFCFET
jgi:hypothetical protein